LFLSGGLTRSKTIRRERISRESMMIMNKREEMHGIMTWSEYAVENAAAMSIGSCKFASVNDSRTIA
jgi:hypothetical protein